METGPGKDIFFSHISKFVGIKSFTKFINNCFKLYMCSKHYMTTTITVIVKID